MFRVIKINVYALFFVITVGSIGCHSKNKMVVITINPFQTEGGWGYDIDVNKKGYIHQPIIPVINGQHAFPTKEIAVKAAQIVVEKIKKQQIPSLTREELKQIGAVN